MIYIGADHRGFERKNEIFKFLNSRGIEIKDCGAYAYDKTDDYNDPAVTVARSVRRDPSACGILICGSALGVTIQANRFKGVRAITATDEELIRLGREHNNANIICLSADFMTTEEMIGLVKVFLTTKFSQEPRHIHRINRLDEREDYA